MEINISIQKKSYLNISDYLFFILKLCITILVAPLEIQKYNKISAFADIIIQHQDAVPTKLFLRCCSYDSIFVLCPSVCLKYPKLLYGIKMQFQRKCCCGAVSMITLCTLSVCMSKISTFPIISYGI